MLRLSCVCARVISFAYSISLSERHACLAVAGSATKSEVVARLCPTDILADPPNFYPSAIGDPSCCLATLMPSSLGYTLLVPLPPHLVRGLALKLRFSVFSALNLCQCCEPD